MLRRHHFTDSKFKKKILAGDMLGEQQRNKNVLKEEITHVGIFLCGRQNQTLLEI